MKKSAQQVEKAGAEKGAPAKSGPKARAPAAPRQVAAKAPAPTVAAKPRASKAAAKPRAPEPAAKPAVAAAGEKLRGTKGGRPSAAAPAVAAKPAPAAQPRKVQQSPAMAKSKTAAPVAAKPAAGPSVPAGGKAKRPAPAKSNSARTETTKPVAETKSGMAAKAEAKTKVAAKPAAGESKVAKAAETTRQVAAPPALKVVGGEAAVVQPAQPKAITPPPLLKPAPKPMPLKIVEGSAEGPGFEVGDHVVYPTHGVGKITAIETQEIAGHILKVFVVQFEKDRMTLRVPVGKVRAAGLRRLSTRKEMDLALAKLRGRSRVKRTMWSRRAQEYEAKINSGDPASIAEVVRDLHRNAGQPDQSYSERQIYQAALDRLARELAAVERIDEDQATQRLEKMLQAAA